MENTFFDQNKRAIVIVACIAIVLAIPAVAMQFTNEVRWSGSDFIAMAVLLLVAGFAIEFVLRTVVRSVHRLALVAAILLAFLLIWAELAVGIFGTPLAGS